MACDEKPDLCFTIANQADPSIVNIYPTTSQWTEEKVDISN